MRMAIYGKGGIGKTTIAVNLALLYSRAGYQVGLVGCDPKEDTTQLLTKTPLPTILEQYEELQENRDLSRVVFRQGNLSCTEIGGPEPGVGCAGRGIIMGVKLLHNLHFFEDKDIVIYDILGDVVCGGFASPVAQKYARDIFIVSSAEPASLFAANNLIKGMSTIGGKVQGLICNGVKAGDAKHLLHGFARATNLPVLGSLSYSPAYSKCEIEGKAMMEEQHEKTLIQEYEELQQGIGAEQQNRTQRVVKALSREEFVAFLRQKGGNP